ncbi:MAG TPA: molybdate ABC transporter substrate-binding protein [Acetobacteraceae bacterium]|nr:molybdate ABC transporter substrate-binding protein [Acetobacteraceae bacterium]
MAPIRLARRSVLGTAIAFTATAVTRRAFAAHGTVTVYAAMTLKDALAEIAGACERAGGPPARLVLGPSATLAKQIEEGAEADVFFPADADWMDYAVSKGVIRAGSRHDLLTSRLVLVGPKDRGPGVIDLRHRASILPVLGRHGRIAMCDPQAMPAGRYGKASLEAIGQWPALANRVAVADTVRAALLMVERGETPVGIVFDTDAASDPAVRVIGVFPDSTHPPIVYPVALTTHASAQAEVFLDYLLGPQAAAVFSRLGYGVVGRPS